MGINIWVYWQVIIFFAQCNKLLLPVSPKYQTIEVIDPDCSCFKLQSLFVQFQSNPNGYSQLPAEYDMQDW